MKVAVSELEGPVVVAEGLTQLTVADEASVTWNSFRLVVISSSVSVVERDDPRRGSIRSVMFLSSLMKLA